MKDWSASGSMRMRLRAALATVEPLKQAFCEAGAQSFLENESGGQQFRKPAKGRPSCQASLARLASVTRRW